MCQVLCWVLSNINSFNSESGNKILLAPCYISENQDTERLLDLQKLYLGSKRVEEGEKIGLCYSLEMLLRGKESVGGGRSGPGASLGWGVAGWGWRVGRVRRLWQWKHFHAVADNQECFSGKLEAHAGTETKTFYLFVFMNIKLILIVIKL